MRSASHWLICCGCVYLFTTMLNGYIIFRGRTMNAPSQWETTLQCNAVSHWLRAFTKWSLNLICAVSQYIPCQMSYGQDTTDPVPSHGLHDLVATCDFDLAEVLLKLLAWLLLRTAGRQKCHQGFLSLLHSKFHRNIQVYYVIPFVFPI